jgi:hypothetical protein
MVLPMFDDLRYRWAVRKHVKNYLVLSRVYDEMPDDLRPRTRDAT